MILDRFGLHFGLILGSFRWRFRPKIEKKRITEQKTWFSRNARNYCRFLMILRVPGDHNPLIFDLGADFFDVRKRGRFFIDFGCQQCRTWDHFGSIFGAKTHQKDHRKIYVKNALKQFTQEWKRVMQEWGGVPLRTLRSKYHVWMSYQSGIWYTEI